jgi:hypothetical protein
MSNGKQSGLKAGLNMTEEACYDAVIKILTDRGIISDNSIANAEYRKHQQERRKKLFQQTKKLMTNYRNIVWTLQHIPSEMESDLDSPLDELGAVIASAALCDYRPDSVSEYRLAALNRSRFIVKHVNSCLEQLKNRPAVSFKRGPREPSGRDLYNILYLTYVSEEHLTRDQILDQLDMSSIRTYYRHMELAIDGLSAILWGGCTPTINAMIQLLMELTDIAETESKKPKSAPQKVAASAKK